MNRSLQRKLARRRSRERGSALLIVFVFAAIIAIALFKEMPIVAFEARRQKEQTLIDRGHQYQRAVQLYYRKFGGRYPANIDMLENTNNMRFLRRRYLDPFTGKDDWRLLHAGPGGMLMDSKVQNSSINGIFGQNGNNIGGNSNATQLGTGLSGGGARNGFGAAGDSTNNTASNSSSGGGVFGSNDSSSSSDSDVVVPPVPKRAPVMAAAGSASGGTPSSNQLDQDPSVPLLPAQDANAPSADTAANTSGGVAPAPANAAAATPNSMQMMQNMFASGANQPQQQTTAAAGFNGGAGAGTVSTTGSTGQMSGGSFAGVASKAKGATIKKINEQTSYSLWDFWYDPTKDTSMGAMGATQNGNGGQNVQSGSQLGQPAAGFGATSTSQPATQITPAPATTDSGAGAGTIAPPPPAQPQQ